MYIYIYVLRMNKNHHKIQVRRSMMVKSKKDNAMKTSGKFTLAQGTARSQHLDEQLLSCMASRGASNGDVDSLISLLRWAGLRNPAGTTSPRRAMVMAKKVHHVWNWCERNCRCVPKKHVWNCTFMQFDAICTLRHHKHNHACYVTIDTRTVCNLHWSSWFLTCLHMQEIQWNSYGKNVVPGTTACSCWICWKPEIALSLFLEANFRRIRRWRVYHSSYPMETDFYIALIIYWYNIDIMNFIMCMNMWILIQAISWCLYQSLCLRQYPSISVLRDVQAWAIYRQLLTDWLSWSADRFRHDLCVLEAKMVQGCKKSCQAFNNAGVFAGR